MTPHQEHPFAHAEQTAHAWLAAVAQEMETDNLAAAHRALRAWLHVVRDRLTPDSLAHLGAQLPALLRGILFDGWVPAHTPVRYDAHEFVARFAHSAGITETEVPNAAAAVTRALRAECSAGQLENVLDQLPRSVREIIGSASVGMVSRTTGAAAERIEELEHAVETLSEAVGVLIHGLEQTPIDEPDLTRTAWAAREAHRVMLAEKERR
ncbi:MAG TPA: DUF2267 domain-containing protein [Pseudonocardiaceae bacterium]